MYHGDVVPGFPHHPHRGFETVTIIRKGLIDHSDSLGALARFGEGDIQWLTAGNGIVHAEMFPLLKSDAPNPLELFQIWLNLPAAQKRVHPYFSMYWNERIPAFTAADANGRSTSVRVIAGELGTARGLPPPPDSWAARPESELAIWTVQMQPHAAWTLPRASPAAHRTLYFFKGRSLRIGEADIPPSSGISLKPGEEVPLLAGDDGCELLLLQGRPIGEPVAHYGPFVMNTQAELRQAMLDYQRTGFGGWPWPDPGPVAPRDAGRFARYPDGRLERAVSEAEGPSVG